MHLLKVILLFGALSISACSKQGISYESRFHDEITLDFPSGVLAGDGEQIKQRMDQSLRASKSGFVSGLMGSGREIDCISIDTDFDQVDEEALVAGFIRDGTLPKDVKADYRRGVSAPNAGKDKKR